MPHIYIYIFNIESIIIIIMSIYFQDSLPNSVLAFSNTVAFHLQILFVQKYKGNLVLTQFLFHFIPIDTYQLLSPMYLI